MNPEIEPSIGERLAAQEAKVIRGYLRLGLGENRKKIIAEEDNQQSEANQAQKSPPPPVSSPESSEIPKP